MKTLALALTVVVALPGISHAQSVAQTLTALSAKITALERGGGGGGSGLGAVSPFVEYPSNPDGGRLDIKGLGAKTTTVKLESDKEGGNLYLYSAAGKQSFTVGTFPQGQAQAIFNHPTTAKQRVGLGVEDTGAGFFSLYNVAGTKSLLNIGSSSGNPDTGGMWGFQPTSGNAALFLGTSDDQGKGIMYFMNAAGTTRVLQMWVDATDAAHVQVNGTNVHDYAEVFDVAECATVTPGSVVAQAADGRGIQLPAGAYDPAVVGVISGAGTYQPGMSIGSRADGSNDLPVAVSGQVFVKVNLEGGPIRVGNLLVSSNTPGTAMRGLDTGRLVGTVVGKALEPYAGEGTGLVRMLVLNR